MTMNDHMALALVYTVVLTVMLPVVVMISKSFHQMVSVLRFRITLRRILRTYPHAVNLWSDDMAGNPNQLLEQWAAENPDSDYYYDFGVIRFATVEEAVRCKLRFVG